MRNDRIVIISHGPCSGYYYREKVQQNTLLQERICAALVEALHYRIHPTLLPEIDAIAASMVSLIIP